VGDLNLTLTVNEKKGGSIVRDQAREWVEDLMSTWELEDIKPVKGKYTWSNKRVGPGHIIARLDIFLVQSSFLVMGLNLESTILPHSVLDHKTITLSLTTDNNLGPIPFCFNPRWIQEESYSALVARIWNGTIIGSPFFMWEENLRRLKKALKSWAKTLSIPIADHQEAQRQLEAHQLELERVDPSQEIMQKEAKLQKFWHQACREEERYWQKKSRCLWLEAVDKNTNLFHKQAEARKQFKSVTEIHT
jgi:hypothetical protein